MVLGFPKLVVAARYNFRFELWISVLFFTDIDFVNITKKSEVIKYFDR